MKTKWCTKCLSKAGQSASLFFSLDGCSHWVGSCLILLGHSWRLETTFSLTELVSLWTIRDFQSILDLIHVRVLHRLLTCLKVLLWSAQTFLVVVFFPPLSFIFDILNAANDTKLLCRALFNLFSFYAYFCFGAFSLVWQNTSERTWQYKNR